METALYIIIGLTIANLIEVFFIWYYILHNEKISDRLLKAMVILERQQSDNYLDYLYLKESVVKLDDNKR